MSDLLLTLAVLACPAGMGLVMWLMMRGGNKHQDATQAHQSPATDAEIARLRAELDQVRAAQRDRSAGSRETGDWN